MARNEETKKPKEQSIAEIEAEIKHIHKKVIRQTADIKTLLKDKTKKSQIPANSHQDNINLEVNASIYELEEAQAEFFASIATINSLISSYEEGRLDPQVYHQQYTQLLSEILKFKTILEIKGISPVEFIRGENIQDRFDLAYKKLKKEGLLS